MSFGHRVLTAVVLLWLLATCLLALAPVVYFFSGSSDSATETGRIALAAVPGLFAWPLLVMAVALHHRAPAPGKKLAVSRGARRASLLIVLVCALLLLAHHLAGTSAIEGDTNWAVFWAAVVVVWAVLSTIAIRRSPRETGRASRPV